MSLDGKRMRPHQSMSVGLLQTAAQQFIYKGDYFFGAYWLV